MPKFDDSKLPRDDHELLSQYMAKNLYQACEVEAEVFPSFLGNLYHSDDKHSTEYDPEQIKSIAFFALSELQEVLQSMEK